MSFDGVIAYTRDLNAMAFLGWYEKRLIRANWKLFVHQSCLSLFICRYFVRLCRISLIFSFQQFEQRINVFIHIQFAWNPRVLFVFHLQF